jgi:flagellin-specific chaperone FliS
MSSPKTIPEPVVIVEPAGPEVTVEDAMNATAQDDNILAIDRMQRVVDRLKEILNSPKRRKILFLRLFMYLAQFILIIFVTRQLQNIWLIIGVSLLISYATTFLVNLIIKRIEVKEDMGEMGKDSMKQLVQTVISAFPIMPAFIQNNLVSFAGKGAMAKRTQNIHILQNYKTTVEQFIAARRAFRNQNNEAASKIISGVIKKAKRNKFEDLLNEAVIFSQEVAKSSGI